MVFVCGKTMNHCSSDTALRDIKELVGLGMLDQAKAGGRSIHYVLRKL
jgi:Fic family protein